MRTRGEVPGLLTWHGSPETYPRELKSEGIYGYPRQKTGVEAKYRLFMNKKSSKSHGFQPLCGAGLAPSCLVGRRSPAAAPMSKVLGPLHCQAPPKVSSMWPRRSSS